MLSWILAIINVNLCWSCAARIWKEVANISHCASIKGCVQSLAPASKGTGLHFESLCPCLCTEEVNFNCGQAGQESAAWCCQLGFGQHSCLWKAGSSVFVKSNSSWLWGAACFAFLFGWQKFLRVSGASGALHWCCHLGVIFFLVIAYLLI